MQSVVYFEIFALKKITDIQYLYTIQAIRTGEVGVLKLCISEI